MRARRFPKTLAQLTPCNQRLSGGVQCAVFSLADKLHGADISAQEGHIVLPSRVVDHHIKLQHRMRITRELPSTYDDCLVTMFVDERVEAGQCRDGILGGCEMFPHKAVSDFVERVP